MRFPFAFMQRLRRHHALHHFHAERGNYGIATGIADRLLGTNYEAADAMPRSATVNNLGYTEEVARRYPWVAMLDRDLRDVDHRDVQTRHRTHLRDAVAHRAGTDHADVLHAHTDHPQV